ncbi:MAG: hypothetical protein EXX96DRAFT_632439 [Benjaminiella poitrasii]|nr:MAG: hypothetical protein EXX96DRAFT_632439 [Benjaminiella poitrasii]
MSTPIYVYGLIALSQQVPKPNGLSEPRIVVQMSENEYGDLPLTNEQIEELYRLFRRRVRTADEEADTEFDLPEEIKDKLDTSSTSELLEKSKKYPKILPQYEKGKWTSVETINKYRLRTTAKAATEIFQDIQGFNTNSLLEDIYNTMENIRRLAVFAFANAKSIDHEAKDLATKVLHLSASVKHLEEQEDNEKISEFSPETVEKINNARFERSVIQSATRGLTYGRNQQ